MGEQLTLAPLLYSAFFCKAAGQAMMKVDFAIKHLILEL